MDLIPIDRGNKRLVERFEGMMGDPVPACSTSLISLASVSAFCTSRSICNSKRPLNTLTGMLLEKVEEAVLFG